MSGIYIHIPFCHKACSYCNFHFSTSLKMKDDVLAALLQEIDLQQNYLGSKTIQTIYFGGGTPSILDEKDLDQIFEKLYQNYNIDHKSEITLEANPEDITIEKLGHWKNIGINRLSIGVQSFHEDELRFMNRNHNHMQSISALSLAKEAGFDNLSADLIFGVPQSTGERWKNNLEQMLSFDIPHLSCYALTVEDHTALQHQIKVGKTKPLSQELAADQFLMTHEFLESYGYKHYEISNYAQPNKEAIHNTNYWNNKAYLGLGPAAHSFDGTATRQWNVANNKKYIDHINAQIPISQHETLTATDLFNEYVMTGLRTTKGLSITKLKSFGQNFYAHLHTCSKVYIESGLIISADDHLRLTPKSMLLADQIISELFYSE